MVLGYDVHHGAAGTVGASVAAMTATFNATYGRSFSTVERLTSRLEVAPKVATMFESECFNISFFAILICDFASHKLLVSLVVFRMLGGILDTKRFAAKST